MAKDITVTVRRAGNIVNPALDLRLDTFSHIVRRAVGNVAVCPDRLLSRRDACLVKEALLSQQHKWSLRMLAVCDLVFGGSNFW